MNSNFARKFALFCHKARSLRSLTFLFSASLLIMLSVLLFFATPL